MQQKPAIMHTLLLLRPAIKRTATFQQFYIDVIVKPYTNSSFMNFTNCISMWNIRFKTFNYLTLVAMTEILNLAKIKINSSFDENHYKNCQTCKYSMVLVEFCVKWDGRVMTPCSVCVHIMWLNMDNHAVQQQTTNIKKYVLMTFMSQHNNSQR